MVVNAEKIQLTGDKLRHKTYYRHSGYPGGLKSDTAEALLRRNPTAVVEKAIKGMLPKNPLGKQMGRKLRVYAGPSHPHKAQAVEPLTFERALGEYPAMATQKILTQLENESWRSAGHGRKPAPAR